MYYHMLFIHAVSFFPLVMYWIQIFKPATTGCGRISKLDLDSVVAAPLLWCSWSCKPA